jgi:glycosyltransferase involved in cell wall biosynthesis
MTTDSRSNVLKKRFKKHCKNVQVIYNVPEIDENNKKVKITNESIAKKIKNRFTITCVGGLSKRKGIINLIKAFDAVQLCSNINILLIGTFKDEESERHVENRSSKNCIHIDWLQYEVMMEYLRYADVGVVPYPPEHRYKLNSAGTSRKFFTYMQAGIPIVGPEKWEIGEIVRIVGNGLLVDTTSPIEIASALLHLKRHNSKMNKMSMRGRRALENKYNWERERNKLIRAYNSL